MRNQIAEKISIITSVTPIGESIQNFKGMNCFAYNIAITNFSSSSIQLLTRHWEIKDNTGYKRIVNGDGVIGQQPTLVSGESFEYDSWCPIPGTIGSMKGHFTFVQPKTETLFKVEVPEFILNAPGVLN